MARNLWRPDYPKGYSIHGIDISHHQGHINWHRLRNALVAHDPLRFVFVKATEGDSHIDTRFRENFDNAKGGGIHPRRIPLLEQPVVAAQTGVLLHGDGAAGTGRPAARA